MNYIPIIGLEIHVELRTNSKMFCGCPATHFQASPNTHTCPVCLGLPGALPVPNRKAIEWTLMIGNAFGCDLKLASKFDRKHYFYPDLAKGYQISQYDEPLCLNGSVDIGSSKIALTRIHLEEDTGKLQHTLLDGKKVSLVDFNRCAVPLVEIVSEPVIKSSADAKAYAQEIRRVINFLGVSDADMEKGTMRLEANISLSKDGSLPDYKVEVKNINSFRFLEKAIDFELKRHAEILSRGQLPTQETRGFDEASMSTKPQRSKEEAKDYRYFPDPDIPPIVLTQAELDTIINQTPKLPNEYYTIFTQTYNLNTDQAKVLLESRKLCEKALEAFELATKSKLEAGKVANFLINKKQAAVGMSPSEIVRQLLKLQTPNTFDATALIDSVIAANPDVVEKYKAGKIGVIGALVGEVLKASKGAADPKAVNELLKAKLS